MKKYITIIIFIIIIEIIIYWFLRLPFDLGGFLIQLFFVIATFVITDWMNKDIIKSLNVLNNRAFKELRNDIGKIVNNQALMKPENQTIKKEIMEVDDKLKKLMKNYYKATNYAEPIHYIPSHGHLPGSIAWKNIEKTNEYYHKEASMIREHNEQMMKEYRARGLRIPPPSTPDY